MKRILAKVTVLFFLVAIVSNGMADFRIGMSDVIYNSKKALDKVYVEKQKPYIPGVSPVTQNIVYDTQIVYDGYSGFGAGNKDGIVNKAESIVMVVTLRNNGSSTIYGVTGEISTTDSYVTIISSCSNASFGTIAGNNGTKSNSAYTYPYKFTVANNAPAGHVVTFNLLIADSNSNSWATTFTATIQDIAANVQYDAVTFYDGYYSLGSGNKNGVINSSETVIMEISLKNTGSSGVYGITADLSTNDSYVVINSSFANIGTIYGNNGTKSNSVYTDPYSITISSNTPIGHDIIFNLNIKDSYFNVWNSSFTTKTQ